MAKAKRPNMLSEDVFRASLHEQNCHHKYVDAYLGDCKLLVPLLIREIGEEQFLEIANKCRAELGLKPVDTYWPQSVKYIVTWAKNEIDDYKASKAKSKGMSSTATIHGEQTDTAIYRIRSEIELQQILGQGQGFLVNKWTGHIKVHDLRHLSDHCRGMLGYSSSYQKYFAESTDVLDERWGEGNWDLCPFCQ